MNSEAIPGQSFSFAMAPPRTTCHTTPVFKITRIDEMRITANQSSLYQKYYENINSSGTVPRSMRVDRPINILRLIPVGPVPAVIALPAACPHDDGIYFSMRASNRRYFTGDTWHTAAAIPTPSRRKTRRPYNIIIIIIILSPL